MLQEAVPGESEPGPITRIFEQLRERENHDSWCCSARELTKGGPRKSTGGGQVMGAHWP
jgi:hypothetical protein